MNRIITSSPTTRYWLDKIRSGLGKRCPNIKYRETKYYVPLYSSDENKNIAQINPQPNQIRIFLRLMPSYDQLLQITPSTSGYAKTFPSLFVLKDESMIVKKYSFKNGVYS
ncbi:MAG: hypothetical protein PHQ76_05730 [Caldisericia bacterium]|nr:hypothetical protein [Caldisericia bacterium]